MIRAVWTNDVCRILRAVISEKSSTPDGLDVAINTVSDQACGQPFFKIENEDGALLGYMYFDGNQMNYELRAHMSSYNNEVITSLQNAALCEIQDSCCEIITVDGCTLLINGIPLE